MTGGSVDRMRAALMAAEGYIRILDRASHVRWTVIRGGVAYCATCNLLEQIGRALRVES